MLFLSSIYYGWRRADRGGSLMSSVPIYVEFWQNLQPSCIIGATYRPGENTPCVQTIRVDLLLFCAFDDGRRTVRFPGRRKKNEQKNASEQASKLPRCLVNQCGIPVRKHEILIMIYRVLSQLRTMLRKSSSQPIPAKKPNHAT